jgi:hypothetical protein
MGTVVEATRGEARELSLNTLPTTSKHTQHDVVVGFRETKQRTFLTMICAKAEMMGLGKKKRGCEGAENGSWCRGLLQGHQGGSLAHSPSPSPSFAENLFGPGKVDNFY